MKNIQIWWHRKVLKHSRSFHDNFFLSRNPLRSGSRIACECGKVWVVT